MNSAQQARAGRRVRRLLSARRGAELLAALVPSDQARANLTRRARELDAEHLAEMRDALRVVRTCPEPRCTLHAGHRGSCWDSMAGVLVGESPAQNAARVALRALPAGLVAVDADELEQLRTDARRWREHLDACVTGRVLA